MSIEQECPYCRKGYKCPACGAFPESRLSKAMAWLRDEEAKGNRHAAVLLKRLKKIEAKPRNAADLPTETAV